MTEKIQEDVDVITIYHSEKANTLPLKIRWRKKDFLMKKLGYHHTERVGRDLHHIFHVANDSVAFRLRHDTTNLSWTLEEVSDGNPD